MTQGTLAGAIGFLLGIIIGSQWPADWPLVIFLLVLGAAVGLVPVVGAVRRGDGERTFWPNFLVSIFILSLALGLGRMWLALSDERAALAPRVGQTIAVTGVVVAEPDRRDTSTKLTVQLDRPALKLLVTTALYPAYAYGDRLRLTGKLLAPQNFKTAGATEFDYVNYLAKDDIYYQIFQPKIIKEGSGGGFWLMARLLQLKQAFQTKLELILSEPQSSLLAGLTVGAKQSLGPEWLERFRRAGVSHLIVLSGYNVTIIADSLAKSLRLLPLPLSWRPIPLSAGLGALAIILFAMMTGGGATVLRAAIMAIIAIVGRATGRPYSITVALLVAALVMVLINPKILVWDIGFQLSFLSTLGLIYLTPVMAASLRWWPARAGLREVAASTLATQLFVLPWLLHKMGLLSLVALPANLLILATVPLTMLVGFLAGLIAFLSATLAWPVALLANLLLSYQLTVVKLLSSLPFAAVTINSFPLWAVLVSYLGIGWWMFKRPHPTLPQREGT